MILREVVTCAFIDAVDRVLFQDRRGTSKFGLNWDYSFFGGSLENGESPQQALIREIREKLDFDLSRYNFRHFRDYKGPFNEQIYTVEHIYMAAFPGFSCIKDLDRRGLVLMPISSARKKRLLPLYSPILDDLETALKNPNFLPH